MSSESVYIDGPSPRSPAQRQSPVPQPVVPRPGPGRPVPGRPAAIRVAVQLSPLRCACHQRSPCSLLARSRRRADLSRDDPSPFVVDGACSLRAPTAHSLRRCRYAHPPCPRSCAQGPSGRLAVRPCRHRWRGGHAEAGGVGFISVGAGVPARGTCAGRHRGRGPTSTGSRRHTTARAVDTATGDALAECVGCCGEAATGVDAGVARGAAGARREGVTRTSPSLRSDRVSPAVTDHDHCLRMTAPTPSASDAGIGHRPRLLAVIAIRRGLARPSSRCGARGSGARGASESARVRAAHRCAQR